MAARSSFTPPRFPKARSIRWPRVRTLNMSPTPTRVVAASVRRMCGSADPEEPGLSLPAVRLDTTTRRAMLEELDQDIAEHQLYLSPVLSGRGRAELEQLLRAAIEQGTEASLAGELAAHERVIPPE